MTRTYKTALEALYTFRRKQGTAGGKPPPGKRGGAPGLYRMAQNLQMLGYGGFELDQLPCIHVAGTKGKGSTCMFTNCFLRAHSERMGYPKKIGLYTMPFLIDVCESFRINGNPISDTLFTKYFFEVWDKLSAQKRQDPGAYKPGYNQLLTILAFHVFFSEKVDVAIFETNSGGTYDATNVVHSNVVGITSLGIDHTKTLGSTIESIAWHKSGIFKNSVPAFSSPQTPAATMVLKERALEVFCPLTFVEVDKRLAANVDTPNVQQKNASLGLTLAHNFLKRNGPTGVQGLQSSDIVRGMQLYSWPGRFQRIDDGKCQWFLDSAHNEMSLSLLGSWFANAVGHSENHASERDGEALVKAIARSLQDSSVSMDYVIFCKMPESKDHHPNNWFEVTQNSQNAFTNAWRTVNSTAQVMHTSSIQEALDFARNVDPSNGMRALVTGSTYLVGPALHLLRSS